MDEILSPRDFVFRLATDRWFRDKYTDTKGLLDVERLKQDFDTRLLNLEVGRTLDLGTLKEPLEVLEMSGIAKIQAEFGGHCNNSHTSHGNQNHSNNSHSNGCSDQ